MFGVAVILLSLAITFSLLRSAIADTARGSLCWAAVCFASYAAVIAVIFRWASMAD